MGPSREYLLPYVHSLICKGYLKQDRIDKAKWGHKNATFYTELSTG